VVFLTFSVVLATYKRADASSEVLDFCGMVLDGTYTGAEGDYVIGLVIDEGFSGLGIAIDIYKLPLVMFGNVGTYVMVRGGTIEYLSEPMDYHSSFGTFMVFGTLTSVESVTNNLSGCPGTNADANLEPTETPWVCQGLCQSVITSWDTNPTVAPTATSQSTPTNLIPTPTRYKPTPTIIKTRTINPLQIETSTNPEQHDNEIYIIPVPQIFYPGEKTIIGVIDSGIYDCLPASTTMVLQTFIQQGLIPNNIDYVNVRRAFREKSPDATNGIGIGLVEVLTPILTNNSLVATVGAIDANHWQEVVSNQIKLGHPVIAHVNNWNYLAGHWPGVFAHSVTIYGFHDNTVFYIDPWDGGRYSLSTENFEKALGLNAASYWLITFELR
jgi:hypothetical protein